jgi:hypothetical protein
VLEGEAGEAPGVGLGDAGDRERPAPVGAAIGESLEQGVLDSRAESAAFAELEVVVRAAVHERGEAVADAHLHRVLRGPLGEPISQLAVIVPTNLPEHSTTDHADEGARTGQIAQVVGEPRVLRRDPYGRGFLAERGTARRWRLGRWRLGRHSAGNRGHQHHYQHAASHRTATHCPVSEFR